MIANPQSPLTRFLLSEERDRDSETRYFRKGGQRLGLLLALAILAIAFSATAALSLWRRLDLG